MAANIQMLGDGIQEDIFFPLSQCFHLVVIQMFATHIEIKSVNTEGNQPCLFSRRTDTEAEV